MALDTQIINIVNTLLMQIMTGEDAKDFDELFGNEVYRDYMTEILKELSKNTIDKDLQRRNAKINFIINFRYVAKSLIEERNIEKISKLSKVLNNLSSKDLVKVISNLEIDISEYYNMFFENRLKDKKFVIEMLKNCDLGYKHDRRLIVNFHSFFYENSEELRKLVFDNPQVYDKLSKAANKPNFKNDFLKQLVGIYGSKYFVSRLNDELKNDKEFMQHIIIEDARNLFRGNEKDYKKRIRDNAYFLFGDNSSNITSIYGMNYILSNTNEKFMDFYNYININRTNEEVLRNMDKILTKEEQRKLFIRGKMPINSYEKYGYRRTNDFKTLLRYNFNEANYDYDAELLEQLYNKYEKIIKSIPKNNTSSIMALADNVSAAYRNNSLEEFDQLINIENENFASMIDMNLLTKEIINKIGIENIQKMVYYPNSLYILSQIINEGNLDTYVELINNKPKSKLAPAVDVNVLLYSTYMFKDAIEDLKNHEQLNSQNVEKIIQITKNNKLLPIENSNDIVNYYDNLKEFCDSHIMQCEDVNYAKEIFFARILKTNRANAQNLIIKYKDGLKEKNSFTYEILELLEIVDGLQDIDAIKNAYNKISKLEIFENKLTEEIEESMKKEIVGKEYINNPKLVDRKAEDSNEYFRNFCNKYGVEGIELDPNSSFEMLVHVLGAYGTIPDGKSIKDTWNTSFRSNVSGICTSLITNNMLQTALTGKEDSSIVFGFLKDLSPESILMCAPYDVWSRNTRLNPDSLYSQNFHDSQHMPDQCRGARGKYNEVVISRYNGEEKRQPDCIILFGNHSGSMDVKSAKVAKEFGIPLVFINEREFLKTANQKLQTKIQEYQEKPDLETAKKLYVEFETIKNGYSGIGDIDFSFQDSDKYQSMLSQKLEEKDQYKFAEFIIEEEKKKEPRSYKKDQTETIKKGKNKVALSMYKDARKNYGLLESMHLMKIKKTMEEMLREQMEIMEEKNDGKHL